MCLASQPGVLNTLDQVGTGQDSAVVSVLLLPMEITSVIGDRRQPTRLPVPPFPPRLLPALCVL
jgi:hypothetical protein